MVGSLKRLDAWAMERFDRAGFYMQTRFNVHVTDIVKYGVGGILTVMTVVIMTARGLTPSEHVLLFAPYAMMWGFYLVVAFPWLTREKRLWDGGRLAYWFFFADGLRARLFPLRIIVFLMVWLFALGPSIVNHLSGHPENMAEIGITVVRSIVTPGFVLPAIYLLCLYPAPPVGKSREMEKRSSGMSSLARAYPAVLT